jgi:GxxExxY protein
MSEESLLVELKTVNTLDNAHRSQHVPYRKATGLRLCPLLNFGSPCLKINHVANRQRFIPLHLRASAYIC